MDETTPTSAAFLQSVIDGVPDALMVIDRNHRVVLANRALRQMVGGKDPVAAALTCYETSHRRDRPCGDSHHPCPLQRVVSSKASVSTVHTHFDADGNEVIVEIIAAPIFDEAGEVVQIIESCRDITARVRAENEARQRRAELAHVERLSTMGQMATDLAHELSQPLSAIVNYVQVCIEAIEMDAGSPDELVSDLERAMEQAERAGRIVEHVRDFVRLGSAERESVCLNRVVREAVALLEFELQRCGVRLRMMLADSLPPVRGVPIQLQQVLVNLLQNGLEATVRRGHAEPSLEIRTTEPGTGWVECAVRDSGCGLPADRLDRVFEPFYTTKPDGVGMGLSICRTIVEAHGGRLWATRNPDY
jgi:PAS domain S-box-containing protein